MKGEKLLDDISIHQNDDRLKAVGIDSKGEKIEFIVDDNGNLLCIDKDLVSIMIPIGCNLIWCQNNLLTELVIPKGCNIVYCSSNELTHLIIPKGCKEVYCTCNNISKLDIPSSVKHLRCDMNVKGLEKIDWNCDIRLR